MESSCAPGIWLLCINPLPQGRSFSDRTLSPHQAKDCTPDFCFFVWSLWHYSFYQLPMITRRQASP